jgi:hypothetical protein
MWALAAAVAITVTASGAAAQQAAGSGPLVLERVGSGLVAAPDVKVTDVDGTVGTLVGGYVGWLGDEKVLIGGAGYWLANGRDDLRMSYGGLLMGWTFNGDGRIAFGGRGLVGAGLATLSDQIASSQRGPFDGRFSPVRFGVGPGGPTVRHVIFDEGFAILEPQGNLVIRLTNTLRLDCGVGYRLIGAASGVEDRLRGVTGSFAVRFGGGQ